tara:strand:+ start:1073 stop:1495 length:423 start_codon:yes stop_codon:yes gene_type:complete
MIKKFLPFFFLIIFTSCSKDIPSDQLEERNGISYLVNSQTPFSGETVEYDEKGNLQFKSSYFMGKLNGPFEMYWGNGNLMGEEFYVDGLPQGISTYYYKTGEVMEIVSWNKGQYDGPVEKYNLEGELIERIVYKNGNKIE